MRPGDFIFISVFILGSIIGLYFLNSVGISGASTIEWVADDSYFLNESAAVTINLFAAFSSSSPLNFTVAEQPELYVVLDGGNLLVAPAPGSSGNVPLVISADDGAETAQKTITFVLASTKAPAETPELTAEPTSAPQPAELPSFATSGFTPSVITACSNISASDTLVNNVFSAGGTCINITGDNVVLDCAGFNITYSTGTSSGNGIAAVNRSNIVIKNCYINSNSTAAAAFSTAINISNTSNTTIMNNTIVTNGTLGNNGIYIWNNGTNVTIANNTINTSGSILTTMAIFFQGVSNSRISNNSITGTTGLNSFAILTFLEGDYLDIRNNSIRGPGIHIRNSTNNNVTNNSILILSTHAQPAIDLSPGVNNTEIKNNIITIATTATGSAAINIGDSTAGGVYNRVLNNTITKVASGTYGGILMLVHTNYTNVTNNTIYNTTYGISIESSCVYNLVANNSVITNSSSSNVYGVEINSCAFNTIHNNTIITSGTVSNLWGIFVGNGLATGGNNITNNTIQTRASGSSLQHGIYLNNANDTIIQNNSIVTYGSGSDGIEIVDGASHNNISNNSIYITDTGDGITLDLLTVTEQVRGNRIINNTISLNTTGTTSFGIRIDEAQATWVENNTIGPGQSGRLNGIVLTNAHNTSIINNTIISNGTSTANNGIEAVSVGNLTIANNSIISNASNNVEGILFSTVSQNSTVYNNTIVARGLTGANNNGIRVALTSNILANITFTLNKIASNGTTNSNGIRITSLVRNLVFNHTNVTARGSIANSASFAISAVSNSTFENTILYNSTNWMNSSASTFNNFTNTTFSMPDGSIGFPGFFNINGTKNITQRNLNVSFNNTFLNATNLSFLNISGQITLFGLAFFDPKPIYNDTDGGTDFSDCPLSICTEDSYSGGAFVYNVTHFTNYSSTEGGDTCATIVSDTILGNSVTAAGTCMTIGFDNVTLDCNGYTITFDTAGAGSTAGVISVGKLNVTIKNCIINDGNNSGGNDHPIWMDDTNITTIVNNTLRSNGTTSAYAIYFINGILINITSSVIENNSILTNESTGSDNYGIYMGTADNFTFRNNTIITNGTSANYGVFAIRGFFHTFERNKIVTNGTNDANYAVHYFFQAHNITFDNNTMISEGPGVGGGNPAFAMTFVQDSLFKNNSIITRGSSLGGNVGMLLSSGGNNTIENNIISTGEFGSANYGIQALSLENMTRVVNNTINTRGTASNNGIVFSSIIYGVISNNSISTHGDTTTNRGILMDGTTAFINITNNIIRTNGSVGSNTGIRSITGGPMNIWNNSIVTNGSTGFSNIGIDLDGSAATNTSIINNTIITGDNTSTDNHGIYVLTAANTTIFNTHIVTLGDTNNNGIYIISGNAIISNANITTWNGTSHGINIGGDSNTSNISMKATAWISVGSGIHNFTNVTFYTDNGSIHIPSNFTLGAGNLNQNELNISFNGSFLDSVTFPTLNQSAFIILRDLPFTDPKLIVDYEDDGIFTDCDENCTEISYAGGVMYFNVSHFTNYSTAEDVATCPLYVNETSTLSINLSCPWTAVIINASNINFTCTNLSTITFDTNGSGSDSGINLTSVQNVTIENCIIIDGNSTGSNGDGVFLADANLSTILNNSVWTNGTFRNIGIHLNFTSYNNTLVNNTIYTTGTDIENHGVFIHDESNFNQAFNNTINTNGTSGNAGFAVERAHNNTVANNSANTQGTSLNTGITVLTNAANNTVANNTFNTNGTSINIGIRLLTNATYTQVINNSVSTHGTSLNNFGIWILGSSMHNNITDNFIRTDGTTQGFGIIIQTLAQNNTVTNNDFVTNGTGGANMGIFINNGFNNTFMYNRIATNGTVNNYGIRVHNFATNNTFDTNNITTLGTNGYGIYFTSANYTNMTSIILNKTVEWINATFNTTNNLTNITFANDNGSIRFIPRIELNGSVNIIQNNTNITFNNTMLNTTNLSFLNVSSQITLLGLPFISPIPMVEVNEDGMFEACYTTCTPVSYDGTNFIYNITHFTNHSASENTTSIVITSGNFTANITPEQSAICTFQTDNLSAADGCFVIVSSAFNGTALSILNNGTAAFGLNITPDVCPFDGACIQQVKANGTAGLPSNASCNPALNFITVTAGTPTNIHRNVPAGEQVFVSLNYTFSINGTPPGIKIVAYNFTTVSDSPFFDPAC